MNTNLNRIRNLKDKKGTLLLDSIKLEYSKEICNSISNNPLLLDSILQGLEMTEEEFFNRLNNRKDTNITFYEQTFLLTKRK